MIRSSAGGNSVRRQGAVHDELSWKSANFNR